MYSFSKDGLTSSIAAFLRLVKPLATKSFWGSYELHENPFLSIGTMSKKQSH